MPHPLCLTLGGDFRGGVGRNNSIPRPMGEYILSTGNLRPWDERHARPELVLDAPANDTRPPLLFRVELSICVYYV